MSHLVPGFLDPDQAGLEDFDVGLRVTSAHSCPNFPGFVLLDQQFPERGLRVTSPPKPARKSQAQTPPGAVARGAPAAADDPRHESPVDPSRDEDAPCAGTAQDHTPPSSSSGSLQPTDRGDTTSGRTDTVSANSSSLSPSTERGRRPTVPPLRQLTPPPEIRHRGWVYSGEQTWVTSRERLRCGLRLQLCGILGSTTWGAGGRNLGILSLAMGDNTDSSGATGPPNKGMKEANLAMSA